ncbi:YhdT family protein [Oceanirhabdus sp. W0125-5]|uniref:YhdT family protein n=1 Tax=Oceanirhabdus sp. W0125-5 TaxID=2999116 RepID=UPI0022F30EBB|nr:YhdT family protein [Oceanirhabdus sp. W0125-5]WBW94733.1 YhdT family protein [Oceanirhabdus sp. W0125-5]
MKSKMKDVSKQLNKEAIMTIGLYIIFFAWWYVFSYGLGNKDVSQYNYILGLPEWFFYSCVLGYVGICIAVFVMVKVFFKDIDFEENDENSREKK